MSPSWEGLDPERWRRITAILDEALELPPGRVPEFLDRTCGDDPDLRRDVEALLEADRQAGDFLDRTPFDRSPELFAGAGTPPPGPEGAPGDRVGPYRLVREIGRGGMGTVHLAERVDGEFQQTVAIKLLQGAIGASPDLHSRFRQERQILARLEHPNIARLLDGGVTPAGVPWFALELVDGVPITQHCRDRALGLREVLALFRTCCRAVQDAHGNLVVHRDLKPANILVTPGGDLKLLDFGIAKLLDPASPMGNVTVQAAHPLTPAYAAPEQLRGEPVTTATDVYALGVVLYELLTGFRPYRRRITSYEEARRAVLEEDPLPPSEALERWARGERPEAARDMPGPPPGPLAWRRSLRGDLDDVTLKALRKEPRYRYLSAEALLDDLEAHAGGRPVRASRATWRYRAGKFVRRNRIAVTAAVAVLLALLGGLVAASWQAGVAERERDRARLESEKATQIKDFTLSLFSSANPYGGTDSSLTAHDLLERGAERVERELAGQPQIQADMLLVLATAFRELEEWSRAIALFDRTLAIQRSIPDSQDVRVARILDQLGSLHRVAGDYAVAESVFAETLMLRRRHLREPNLEIASSLINLAAALHDQGESAAPESLYRAAIAMDEALLGTDHLDMGIDYTNFGIFLSSQQRFAEAESIFVKALDIRRRKLGEDHLFTADTEEAIANCLEARGDLDGADQLYQHVLSVRRHRLPAEHSDLARVLDHLAGIRGQKGNFTSAESLLTEAIRLRQRALGPRHYDVGVSINNLAVLHYRRGRYPEAEKEFEAVISIWNRALGPEAIPTLTARNNLASVMREEGDYAESERIFREVLASRRTLFGDDHPMVSQTYHNLGQLLRMKGESAEAEDALRKALAIRGDAFGAQSPATLQTVEFLAGLLREQERYAEAESLYAFALPALRATFEGAHEQTAGVLVGYGRLLADTGRQSGAEPLLREGLAMRATLLDRGDPRIAEAEAALGLCLIRQGKPGEARTLLAGALPALKARPSSPDPIVALTRSALAELEARPP